LAIRLCPHCGNTVPAAGVVAFSDGLECPHCETRLVVADGSRMIAVTVGLIAAFLVWRVSRDSTNIVGFALPVLLSFLAFGIVSPLVLMFTAALRIAPSAVIIEPVVAHGGQGQTVHGHAGGRH
jgi:hypothetical protein